MFRSTLLAGVTAVLPASPLPGKAQPEVPATLVGHAVMPTNSFVAAPEDDPADLAASCKYTTGKRVDVLGTVMGKSFERDSGVKLPFQGQPRQGHSGIKTMPDGSFWVLTDNGFGAKANSPDSMLYLSHYRIDWASDTWQPVETIFMHDPQHKVPFRIVHEGTERRYLTGSDFDTEGVPDHWQHAPYWQ
jgi:hypothetical protein